MLDHLKAQQAAGGRRETARLMVLVGLALGAVVAMVGTRSCAGEREEAHREPALVPAVKEEGAVRPVPIDRERVLQVGDGPAAHQDDAYRRGALDYVLSIAGGALAEVPKHVTAEGLAALPFADAAGHVYEVRGTVVDEVAREFRTPTERLWTLVLQGPPPKGGAPDSPEKEPARFLVLKQGFSSEPQDGKPRAASEDASWIEAGDAVVVRGIYLQRRSGTIGGTVLREPVPVLVLVQARKAVEPVPAISDPSKADWDEVEDRFMAETRNWQEPALFQVVQWAQERGAAKVSEDIRSGRMPSKKWDRSTFDVWEKEIEVTSQTQARPFTDSARGKLWHLNGIVGQVVYEGWETPMPANPQGVDHLYVWDILSEDYSVYGRPINLRCLSPFPPDAFGGITGLKHQSVTVYGLFLKNFTYVSKLRSVRQQGPADITVPTFILLHVEPLVTEKDTRSLWILAGSMVFLAAIFYFVLIRGERKESKRMEVYRRGLRQRMRSVGQGPMAGTLPTLPPTEDPAPPPPEGREGT